MRQGPLRRGQHDAEDGDRGGGAVGRTARRSDPEDGHPEVVAGIAITHPGRVLYPEAGYTKLDVARYYAGVGAWLLPHLAHRPLTLLRCPTGWGARGRTCFYQRHRRPGIPDVVQPIEVRERGGARTCMMANSVAAVVALVQIGALEFHPWGSREGALDRPDRIVLDFDPDEGLGWPALVDAVVAGRTLLENLGLRGFLRTTGGKGLHVVVPIEPTQPWDAIKGFARAISDLLVRTFPDRLTATASLGRRTGRVFVDYLRNAEGATAIAPYSLRAKAHAPVAMPVAWTALREDLRFAHFDLAGVPKHLAARGGDPWSGFFELRQDVTPALVRRAGRADVR